MSRPAVPRFAAKPLLDRFGGDVQSVATTCGVATRQVYRWIAEGVPESHADWIAIAAGCHPSELWGDAWWDATPPNEQTSIFDPMEQG